MRKGRKALSMLLLICVCITSCFGYAPISASAAELPAPVLSYLAGNEQAVANGTNYYAVTSSEDVNRIKNLTDFTICMEYKTTSSGLQSIFFADGNGATTNQYFNMYIWPQNVTATGSDTKVGIEIRDGSKNPAIYSTVDVHSLDGNWHKIAMTYKSGTGYDVYLDNIKVGSFTGSDYNTRFLNSLGVATDNMSFGSGTRVSGNNYPFTGSIRNIKMYDQVLSSSDLEGFMTAGITIDSPTALFTSAGEKKQLQATVKPAGSAVTWTSSDTSVATVSETGLVTAVASGNAAITATSADGSSAVCAVKVAILTAALEKRDLHLDGTSATVVDLSAEADSVKILEKGTITARYRSDSDMTNSSANLMTLFSISDKNASGTYMNFFVSPAGNSVGYELQKNDTAVSNLRVSAGLNLTNTKWHTVSYVFDKANSIFVIYVDGKVIKSENAQKDFLSALSAEGNCVRIGDMSRATKGDHLWPFKGDIEFLQVSGDVCTAEQIAGIHEATVDKTVTVVPEIADRAADVDLYTPGVGSVAYRIPSLLTTKKGTVLAVADRRNSGWGDSGDISFAVRRSTDSGKTWSPMQIVYDPPADTTPGSGGNSLLIDAVMVQDQTTEDIYCMMDFFPESSALMGPTETNSGYTQVGDKRYLTLKFGDGTIAGSTGSYVLGDDQAVYLLESDGTTLTKSEYTVPDFKAGTILRNGADAGNIFLYGETNDSLNIIKTNYLWMFKSSDEGQTWSDPVDVSKYLKKDWMKFLGTGPGVGMQIENGEHAGRLIIPVYMTNSNVGASQSSAVMYSDDHGVTWTLGESANEGRNGIVTETMTGGGLLTESQVVEVGNSGVLKLFCRNSGVGGGKVVICTSTDGGATWNDTVQIDPALTEVYCQLSVIKWPEKIDGKTAYVFANATVTDRMNGKVRIGFYDEATDKFTWPYEQLIVNGKYAYSCLTALPNGRIGLLYEGEAANGQWHRIMFADFNVEWVTAQRQYIEPAPSITNVEMAKADGKLTFNVTFDQAMIAMKAPVLKFQLNGVDQTAALVSSGNAGKEFVFEYALAGTESGNIVVTNVAANPAQAASSIGNYANQMPADVAETFALEGTEVPAGDKTALAAYIAALGNKTASDYTSGSFAAYTAALAAANTVNGNAQATQDEIDGAKAALETAVAGLVNKTALTQAIAAAGAKIADDYTTESFGAYTTALAAANAADAKADATAEEISKAVMDLNAAVAGLVEITIIVPEDPTVSFINRLYELVLGREAEDDGVAYYEEALAEGDTTGADLGYSFIKSPEFTNRNMNNSDYVEVLYNTFMDRASDEGGKAYWMNMLENGVSRDYVFKGFAESEEYKDICDSYGIISGTVTLTAERDQNAQLTMFINRIYTKALGRAGEEEGIEYYAKAINSGEIDPIQVAKNFIFSPEFEDKNLADEEYVKVLYRTFMDREYDAGGLQYHLDRMDNGVSKEDILDGFAFSPEFNEIMSGFGLVTE
ncbi:DUF4214 domain-containing protein [Anaerobium acetethylicum]|uniref:exo-alpha-sialidase n=1 Tax=Anaerobium acetethylicum TaxID=1619234 RepID=A0A1D3TSM0_9FIRM|nr:DUF4214 domain-containing protein [Anaerobium acetethylicum]SCP96865.1 Neuraminidase (sialidase) [Anaerobium acetethylicum]